MQSFQQYLTDLEIAEAVVRLGINGLPTRRRGITRLALREGWRSSSLARVRSGREGGGGYEYHWTLLPMRLQEALQAEYLLEGEREAAERMARAANNEPGNAANLPAGLDASGSSAGSDKTANLPALRGAILLSASGNTGGDKAPARILRTADLTGRQREVMEARLVIVQTVLRNAEFEGAAVSVMAEQFAEALAAGAVSEQMQRFASKANDRSREGAAQPLSARTVLRWIKRFRMNGAAALAPFHREQEPVPAWMKQFMEYYGLPSKPSAAQALRNWQRDCPQAKLPGIGQIRSALAKMTAAERNRGRMGEKELKQFKSYVARDVSTMLPAELYQADGKTFNAEVAHPLHGRPFRPELTTIIDARTRRIVGWSAALDESANAVADALLMAVSKAGIPAIFYTDNGPGYKNAAMEDSLTGLLARLSITPMHALPYNSQAKGQIERFNRQWTDLARDFGTYMGRDMDREAASLTHKITRAEIREEKVSRTLPSWQAFLDACAAMLDAYNNRPHRGLEKITDPQTGKKRHLSPNEAWRLAEAQGFKAETVSEAELAELRLVWEARKVRRGIVELFGNQYYAPELERYHGEEIIAAYSPTDAESIICREITLIDGERKAGALIGKAMFAGHKTRMVPLTASEKAMETRHKGRLARVGRKAEEIDDELRQMTIEGLTVRPLRGERPLPAAYAAPQLVKPQTSFERTLQSLPDVTGKRKQETQKGGQDAKKEETKSRPNFKGDIDYAQWLTANPEQATPQDIINIKEDLLGTAAMQDWLNSCGVDLSALLELARSRRAAA